MLSTTEISLAIKNEALRLGFSACGFSKAEYLEEDADRLSSWLEQGYHGSMAYMERNREKRSDPSKLVEGARSVISVLLNYYSDKKQEDPEAPVLSKYAYGIDYHFVIKDMLRSLELFIEKQAGGITSRIFVDSAPVLDRAWARKAGLGWIGKNSNLINREYGSFVFIGEVICDLELAYNDIPESDFCGACSLCIDACPTDAILPGRTIDSNKCISYLTIENRSEIPEEFRGKLENRVFGCDICQDVCPWNRKAVPNDVASFKPNPELMSLNKADWHSIDKNKFRLLFKDSAVKRGRFEGLKRNLLFLDNQ